MQPMTLRRKHVQLASTVRILYTSINFYKFLGELQRGFQPLSSPIALIGKKSIILFSYMKNIFAVHQTKCIFDENLPGVL